MTFGSVGFPRIIHMTTVHGPLDTRIYYKEVRSLANDGYDVRLATTVAQHAVHDGVRLLPLGERSGGRWKRIARDVRALVTVLTNRQALIHIHDPELLLVCAVPAALGARVIFDVHEYYSERIAASTWIPSLIRGLVQRSYDAIERIVVPQLAGVVIVSEGMRARYERLLDPARVALVRNFPNLDATAAQRARESQHPLDGMPYVLHTGGALKLRAFDDLVAAAESLQREGSDLRMVVLGVDDLRDYAERDRAALRRRADDAGVLLLGNVSYAEAQRWLAHARVAYLPLSDTPNNRMGMPNKLFEYSFFGLPVVATDLGIVAETIQRHDFGVLVPEGDGARHAQAMIEIDHNGALRERLMRNANEAAQSFSFASEYRTLHALYDRVCTMTS